jgi:hypothetical protein
VTRSSIVRAVRQIRRACAAGDATVALEALTSAVADYEPSEVAVKAARLVSLRVNAPSSKAPAAASPAALQRSA